MHITSPKLFVMDQYINNQYIIIHCKKAAKIRLNTVLVVVSFIRVTDDLNSIVILRAVMLIYVTTTVFYCDE